MFQYNILLKRLKQMAEEEKITLKEAQKLVREDLIRIELETTFENLKCLEIKIKKSRVEEKIKRQIIL